MGSQPAASASAAELLDFSELQAHAQAELDYDLNLEIKDLLAMSASCGFSASSSPSRFNKRRRCADTIFQAGLRSRPPCRGVNPRLVVQCVARFSIYKIVHA